MSKQLSNEEIIQFNKKRDKKVKPIPSVVKPNPITKQTSINPPPVSKKAK